LDYRYDGSSITPPLDPASQGGPIRLGQDGPDTHSASAVGSKGQGPTSEPPGETIARPDAARAAQWAAGEGERRTAVEAATRMPDEERMTRPGGFFVDLKEAESTIGNPAPRKRQHNVFD